MIYRGLCIYHEATWSLETETLNFRIVISAKTCITISATINIVETRAILRIDIRFYIGIMVWPLLRPLHGMHALGLTRNVERAHTTGRELKGPIEYQHYGAIP